MEAGEMSASNPHPDTTTVSTIVLQSGPVRLVVAILQSGEWITVKLVEAQPDLTSIGNDLQEAVELQTAHSEVLRQLKNKATPVEELMRQVDKKVSSQRPEPEVYAAMAESLGTAWQSINNHLEHRKQILDLSVTFQTNFEQCLQRMEALNIICRDEELPIQIDAVKQALTEIHDLRRSVLESVMAALQEGGHLLDHLKDLNNIGTLDSRPGQIKPSVGSAIKQVESWLEAMHDRRKILEISWQNRKNRLEQCLALAMLARDLHELEDAIREHKERIGSDIYLGESEYETSMLIVDINNFLKEVKELQERAIKITRATEQLVKSGCFAGREASDKAYSVLGGCSDFLNDLESRETLLTRAQAFYENGRQVLNRLDDFEREVRQNDLVGMLPRLTPVTITNAVDEITQDVIREGRDLLTECGVNNPGSQGVRNLLEEIENRAIELRRKCDEMRRTDRKIGEALFAFQEKQDELSSWLRTISEISLKERRDMGHDLLTAKDFYSFHHELLKNLEIKGNEINALLLTLPPILEYLDDEQRREVDRKVESLHENWTTLKALVELRLDLSSVFVQFLTDADKLSAEFDTLDQLLVRSSAHSMEDKIRLMDVQWNVIKPMYDQLKNSGTGFKRSAEQRAVSDRHLAIGTACSLIDEILNGFSGREFRLIEQQETWRTQITTVRQVYEEWRSAMEQTRQVINWISKLDSNIYPVLTSPTSNASELVAFAESTLQRVTNEIVQAQNDIQTKLRLTEDLVAQDTSLLDETQPVKNNLQELQQKLNTTSTEYKLLVQSIISFLRNVAELDKSIENIQSKHRLPVDLQTDLENFAKDHEASKKIIMEMFKLIVNESDEVINKIRQQEPKLAAQHDIEKILTMLEHRKSCFEASWNATKLALDESMKTGQFDADLKDINSTLDDLVRQLASVRGQYGETLATAKASSLAFEYFERTIELLQNRIDGFVSSSNEIFSDQTKDYPRIKRDLDALSSRWNGFRHEVSEVRRLIDLSMQYFKLVDETDDWFGEGNKLLLTVASKIATIKTEDDANKLLSEMEHFISSGEYKQNERLNKMSALARDLYDDSRYSHLNKIQNSNRDMTTSFETMRDNLRTAIDNLKAAAIERDEVDRSLAEKAKLEAELLAQSEMIQQITVKTTTSESQTVDLGKAPEFTVLLTDAVVPEGSKFTFECQVVGDPEPDVTWYKDGMSIQNNPDYKTVFENGKCSLTIEETFTEDSAKFRCKAINNYGSADTCATLSVRETDVNTLLQPPQFVELLKPGKAMEGKSFQFECKVIGNPLPTVQWYKNDVCIDNSKDYGITYNNGEAVLRFEEVFLEDHALYMCKATNDAGIDQCQAYLMVEPLEPTEKPVFVIPLSNTMARAGQKVKLECQVSGIPEPQIQWTHNGKPFMETSDSKLHRDGQRATLIINEAFPKDAGLYAATARNIAGTVTSSCNVSVKGLLPNETSDSEQPSDMEPIKPSVQMPLQDRSAFERDSVRFDCIIVGQPEPEVIWYHNDRPVKESSEFQLLFQGDRCSLIIREVFSEDAGVYKVVAINSAGEASSTCILKVNKPQEVTPPEKVLPTGFAPKFTRLLTDVLVPENEKVLLECEVTGDPKPYVKWYHNTRELISNERYDICLKDDGVVSLTILQVHPDDKGLYTVKAFNTNGDAKCFANLIVKSVNVGDSQKPVQIQAEFGYIAPQFKELFSDCKVPDGCPAKFECIVTGKPTPKIKWLFNNSPVTGKDFLVSTCGDRQILTIPAVTENLKGNISCVAENEVGRTTCVAALSVDSSQTHHELVMPIIEQNSNDTKSIYMKQEIITQSSSHSSTTYGSGEPKHVVHQVTSQSHSTEKQINNEPPVVTQTQKIEEYHQTDKEPASTREETLSSTTMDQNTSITESVTTKIEPVKIFHHVRKSVSPRFISPLVGRIVDKGSDIVLEGIVDGYPTPVVKWTKNGQDLYVGGNVISMTYEFNKARIELKNVGIEDAGRFTCTATNSAGVVSSTADIVVKKSVFPPVFGRRLQAQVVKKGDRVIMEVEVSGTPEPTVTWHKDGKPIQEAMASPFRLKTQGLCHQLIIDKVSMEDTGKYMVRAINAGGEAQSIADFAVFEPTPDTMVEVVKTMVYEDLQDQTQKKPMTSLIQQPVTSEPMHQDLTSNVNSQVTTQMTSQTESVLVTETRQTEQKFKMEHKTSLSVGTDFPSITQQTQTAHISTMDKKSETEPKLSFGMNTETTASSDKSTVTDIQPFAICQTDGIESGSISKKSALDFFVSKMQTPVEQIVKPEEPKVAIFPYVPAPIEEVTYGPKITEYSSVTKQEYSQSLLKDFGLEPGPPPEIGYMPKTGSVKRTEDVAQKIKKLQEIQKDDVVPPTGGIKLFSIPPTPKEEIKECPLDGLKAEFNSQIFEQTSYENKVITEPVYRPSSDIEIRPTSPRPSAEAIDMQKLWNRPISPKDKSSTYWSSDNEYRSFSEMSQTSDKGVPSADGVAMDKIWSHKRPDSSLPIVWPPMQEEEQKVETITSLKKEETKTSSQYDVMSVHKQSDSSFPAVWSPKQAQDMPKLETVTHKSQVDDNASIKYNTLPKIQRPEQKLHYVAHTTVSEKQNIPVIDSTIISEEIKKESKIFKEIKTEEKSWQRHAFRDDYALQSPQMVQKLISKTREDMSMSSETKDDIGLKPGPEPEMCFAPRTTLQRRQSHVETIEQDLEKALDKIPSRVLPGAVRTIPPPKTAPPIPPKDQYTPAPPLPAKPTVELSAFKPFPELEPFPFKPEPEVPKMKCPPPATPSKFIKGEFIESDYESEIENAKIKSKWTPGEVKEDSIKGFRRVQAPSPAPKRPLSTEPVSLPPSQFEKPLEIEKSIMKVDKAQQESFIKSTTSEKHSKTSEVSQISDIVSSEPVLIPGPPPVFAQTEPIKKVKVESPKTKPKFQPESGYMADTEDTLRRFSKMTESKSYQHESTNISYESTERKSPPIKVYRHHVRADKTFVQPVVASESKDATIKNISMTSREIKISDKLEPFPYKPDAPKPKRASCPPPPSPSKFVKGEFRESDYESDYDSRIPAMWRPIESDTDEKTYRPVHVSLSAPKSGRYSRNSDGQKSPTPPTEFDNPPEFTGPPRPKFSPIEKLDTKTKTSEINKTITKQQIYKPKPVAAKALVQDHIIATPAVRKEIILQPGPQPEMGYVPPPKRTQYYTGKAGIPVANAIETSKTMQFNESTESSHRVLNISQTTRVIKFGEDTRQETKLEPFPYKPEAEKFNTRSAPGSVPKPKKFIPGEFRESDYESEVESTRIKAKWAPPDSDSEEPYYRKVRAPVFTRSASLPRSYGRVMTPMEFDKEPPVMPTEISKTLDIRNTMQRKQDSYKKETFTNVATSLANSHMTDMSEMFRSKVHRFADDVLTDVKQQSKQQKPILKTSQQKSNTEDGGSNAQAYREESRFAQYGTKHIDPDTGLIYFKYDFGYEFGILFPGEGKKVLAGGGSSAKSSGRTGDIEVPIIHEKTNGVQQGFNTLPLCKKPQSTHKNVKWESESEWSEAEEIKHQDWRYDQPTPSPKSLSPSIPSQSPRYFYQPDASDRSCNSTPASSRVYSTGHNGEIAKPPLFITPLKDIAAVSGQPARFECIVQSEPSPSIVWAKDGRMLQPTLNHEIYFRNGVCRLTLLKAYPDDAGTYTCTATNCAGAVGCSATLQVPGEKWSTYLRKP